MVEKERKARAKTSDTDRLVAAYLRGVLGWEQVRIASFLNLSPSVISRFIKEAEAPGTERLIETSPRFVGDHETREAARVAYEQKVLLGDLKKKLMRDIPEDKRHILQSINICPVQFLKNEVQSLENRIQRFGEEAAIYVRDLLTRQPNTGHPIDQELRCGVARGRSVLSLCWGLQKLGPMSDHRPESPARFFPVWGEFFGKAETDERSTLFSDDTALSATTLAGMLSNWLNDIMLHTPSLHAAPVIIPTFLSEFKESEENVELIKMFIHLHYDYTKVFGKYKRCRPPGDRPEDSLIYTMNTLIAGIGCSTAGGRFYKDDLIRSDGILEPLVLGDLGGALVHKRDLNEPERLDLNRIKSHWMGIELEDVTRCAMRAAAHNFPGVIAIAVGEERAEITSICLYHGIINNLIIDRVLAQKISQLPER